MESVIRLSIVTVAAVTLLPFISRSKSLNSPFFSLRFKLFFILVAPAPVQNAAAAEAAWDAGKVFPRCLPSVWLQAAAWQRDNHWSSEHRSGQEREIWQRRASITPRHRGSNQESPQCGVTAVSPACLLLLLRFHPQPKMTCSSRSFPVQFWSLYVCGSFFLILRTLK